MKDLRAGGGRGGGAARCAAAEAKGLGLPSAGRTPDAGSPRPTSANWWSKAASVDGGEHGREEPCLVTGDYLTGRVYSARFEEVTGEADPEWPPHPSRLFSGLTAAWGREERSKSSVCPGMAGAAARPQNSGEHIPGALVQAFVPVNDSRDAAVDVHERRGRSLRRH